jgi:DNA integrity scanning protein DisA with diadenylate cyclase activity
MTGTHVFYVVREVADVVIVAVVLFVLLVWLRNARARFAVAGASLIGAAFLAARQLGLAVTAVVFQGLFVVAAVMLALAFQDDLRRTFERFALALVRPRPAPPPSDLVTRFSLMVFELARRRHGALLVLPGREPLERHVDGGIPLGGDLSEPLLLSLFDPHSPGHDGAAVVQGGRLRSFGAHLPLSSNLDALGRRGTRHAAALGLAERSDATCIVVSEEHGDVSLAQGSQIVHVPSAEALAERLRRLSALPGAPSGETSRERLRRVGRPLVLASLGSVALWALVVPGSETAERLVRVPVTVDNLPDGYSVERVSPAEVEVVVTGLRRRVLLLAPGSLDVRVDGLLVQLGRRTFGLSPQSVTHPPGVTVLAVQPESVVLSVKGPASETSRP